MNIRGFEEPKLILRSNVADFAFGRKIGLLLMKDGSLWEMNSRKVLEPHKKRDHILFGGQADPFGPAPGAIAREPVTPSYQTFIPSRTPIAESVVSIEQSWYEDSAYFIKSDGSLWQLKTEEFPQKQVQLPIDPFDEKYVKVDPIPPGKLESKYTYPPQSLHFPEKDSLTYTPPKKIFPQRQTLWPSDNSFFRIENGKLLLSQPLDPRKKEYTVHLRGKSPTGKVIEQRFTIPVKQKSAPPKAILLSSNRLQENSSPGTIVGNLTVIDYDPDDEHTVELAGHPDGRPNDNDSFRISMEDGKFLLETASGFYPDYEQKRTLKVRIRATDKDGLSFSDEFDIEILNERRFEVRLSITNDEIPENATAGYKIGVLKVNGKTGHDYNITLLPYNDKRSDNRNFVVKTTKNGHYTLEVAHGAKFDHHAKSVSRLQFALNVREETLPKAYISAWSVPDPSDLKNQKSLKLQTLGPLFLNLDKTTIKEQLPKGSKVGEFSLNGDEAATFFLTGIHSAAAGSDHSLFIKDNGELWGMGLNKDGQLGKEPVYPRSSNNPNTKVYPKPQEYDPIQIEESSVIAAAGGGHHSLFIKENGSLWGMGKNSDGQLGIGTKPNTHKPVKIWDAWVQTVAAGTNHSLFIGRNGSLWAMGVNGFGQLGDGTTQTRHQPVKILDSGVQAISAGHSHSLVLKTDGSLWGMGSNNLGQISGEDPAPKLSPTLILESDVTAISAYANYSLFLKSDGSLWELGNPGEQPTYYPYQGRVLYKGIPKINIPEFIKIQQPIKTKTKQVQMTAAKLGGGILVQKDGHVLEMIRRSTVTSRNKPSPKPILTDPFNRSTTVPTCQFNEHNFIPHNPSYVYTDPIDPDKIMTIHQLSAGNGHTLLTTNYGIAFSIAYSSNGARGCGYEMNPAESANRSQRYEIIKKVPNQSLYHKPLPTSNHLFRIQGNQLLTTQPLDFETQPTHKIHVAAINSEGLHITKTFTIQVEDAEEP